MENQIQSLRNWVAEYQSQGQHELAVQLCQQFIHGLQKAKGDANQDMAIVFTILAQVHHSQNKFEDAADRTKDALKIFEAFFGPKDSKVAETLTKLGDFYCKLRKFVDADAVYNRALDIFALERKNGCRANEAEVLLKLGSVCNHQEQYGLAEFYLNDSRGILNNNTSSKCSVQMGKVKLELAKVYVHKDELGAAQSFLNHALDFFGGDPAIDSEYFAQTYHYMAKCFVKQGNLHLAQDRSEIATAIYEKSSDYLNQTDTNLDLGNCLLKQGKLAEARKYFEKAVGFSRKLPQDSKDLKLSDALLSLATCLKEQGKFGDAGPPVREALALLNKSAAKRDSVIAQALFLQANILIARGKMQLAEKPLRDAITLLEGQVDVHYELLISMKRSLGDLYLQRDRSKKAAQSYREALDICKLKHPH